MLLVALLVIALLLGLFGQIYGSGVGDARVYPYRRYAGPSFGTLLLLALFLYLIGVR